MKKTIFLLLALVLCLTLCACGDESADTPTTAPNTIPTTAPTSPTTAPNTIPTTAPTSPTTSSTTTPTVPTEPEHIHDWTEATCTDPKTCKACGSTEGSAKDHDWVAATCAAPKTCKSCNKTEGDLADHAYQETARVDATSHQDGSATYTCSVCGNVYTEVLYATGSVGLEYEINDYGTYTVVGLGSCTDSHVVIPRYHEGTKVTAIGNRAFYNCTTIMEITVPETVDYIGTQIFLKCSSLHTVYYNGTYSSAGNSFLNVASIKKVVFGGNVIPNGVCDGANNIEEVVILDSVTKIDRFAFQNCSNLTSIVIPTSLTNIGRFAFNGCTNLQSIYITDIAVWCNVQHEDNTYLSAADWNLYLNGELVSVLKIPDSVTSIGRRTFSGCNSLTSIVIPDSLTSIDEDAFDGCSNLRNVYITDITAWCHLKITMSQINESWNLYLNGELVTSLEIPDGVTLIRRCAFSGCSSLTRIVIPDSVTSMSWNAFQNCDNLQSVVLSNGITSIGAWTFYGCSSLTSVTIPDSVISISSNVFMKCYSLTEIRYAGTKEQWNDIEKDLTWDSFAGNYTVYCTDGKIEN